MKVVMGDMVFEPSHEAHTEANLNGAFRPHNGAKP